MACIGMSCIGLSWFVVYCVGGMFGCVLLSYVVLRCGVVCCVVCRVLQFDGLVSYVYSCDDYCSRICKSCWSCSCLGVSLVLV